MNSCKVWCDSKQFTERVNEASDGVFYLAAMFVHRVHGSSDGIIHRFTLFHLSLHIMLKIWTDQKIVVSPFICCSFGLCLNHSIYATDC